MWRLTHNWGCVSLILWLIGTMIVFVIVLEAVVGVGIIQDALGGIAAVVVAVILWRVNYDRRHPR